MGAFDEMGHLKPRSTRSRDGDGLCRRRMENWLAGLTGVHLISVSKVTVRIASNGADLAA